MSNKLGILASMEAYDGTIQKELEYVFYGKLSDFTELDKAVSKEEQEQWEIRVKESAEQPVPGCVRVRKLPGEQYILCIKTINKESDAKDEVEMETTKDVFEQIKKLATGGMHKMRYVFEIGQGKNVWEVDVYFKPDGTMHEWCKVELEVKEPIDAVPSLPVTMTDTIVNQPRQRTDEENALVDKLMAEVFVKKNLLAGGEPVPQNLQTPAEGEQAKDTGVVEDGEQREGGNAPGTEDGTANEPDGSSTGEEGNQDGGSTDDAGNTDTGSTDDNAGGDEGGKADEGNKSDDTEQKSTEEADENEDDDESIPPPADNDEGNVSNESLADPTGGAASAGVVVSAAADTSAVPGTDMADVLNDMERSVLMRAYSEDILVANGNEHLAEVIDSLKNKGYLELMDDGNSYRLTEQGRVAYVQRYRIDDLVSVESAIVELGLLRTRCDNVISSMEDLREDLDGLTGGPEDFATEDKIISEEITQVGEEIGLSQSIPTDSPDHYVSMEYVRKVSDQIDASMERLSLSLSGLSLKPDFTRTNIDGQLSAAQDAEERRIQQKRDGTYNGKEDRADRRANIRTIARSMTGDSRHRKV